MSEGVRPRDLTSPSISARFMSACNIQIFIDVNSFATKDNQLNKALQSCTLIIIIIKFLARDSMLSALYANARPSVRLSVRLSVCPSVRHTGGSVENG